MENKLNNKNTSKIFFYQQQQQQQQKEIHKLQYKKLSQAIPQHRSTNELTLCHKKSISKLKIESVARLKNSQEYAHGQSKDWF